MFKRHKTCQPEQEGKYTVVYTMCSSIYSGCGAGAHFSTAVLRLKMERSLKMMMDSRISE